jgi:O-antigen ligase
VSSKKQMGKRLRISTLAAMVVALTIAGYPLIAASTAWLDVEGRIISIAMRALIVGLVLVVLTFGLNRGMPKKRLFVATLLLTTLAAYGLRLISEVILNPETLGQPISTYLLFFFGATLAPTLSVLFARRINWDLALRLTFAITTAASFISFLVARQAIDAESHLSYRGELEGLNSISLGNLGVTLALLCIWWLSISVRASWARRCLVAAFLVLGLGLALYAASRGAIVGFVLPVMAMGIAMHGRAKLRYLVISLILSAIGYIYIARIVGIDQLLVLRRFTGLFLGTDKSSSVRVELYSGAIEQILANPWLGKSIEVPSYRFYPHNLFLEYFMATGLFAGWLFVALMLLVLSRGFPLLRKRNPQSWVFIIFLQSLIGGMFSGSIYASSTLWITAALTLTASQLIRSNSKSPMSAGITLKRV